MTTAATVHDPLHRAHHAFTPDGENLIVDTWLEPGGKLPPHLHPVQEEHWSVVEGEIEIMAGSVKRIFRPEDGEVPVPPGTKHGLRNRSDQVVHARCRVIPALNLEEFLTDSAAAMHEGLLLRGDLPRGLRGARWAARFLKRHRGETVMLWPPRFAQSAMISLLARD